MAPWSPWRMRESALLKSIPQVVASLIPPSKRPPISIPQVVASSMAPSRSRPLSMALASTIDRSLQITPSCLEDQSLFWSQACPSPDLSPQTVPLPISPKYPRKWTIPNSPVVLDNVTQVPNGDYGNSPFSMDKIPLAHPSPKEKNSPGQIFAPQPKRSLGNVPQELAGQVEALINQTREYAQKAPSNPELIGEFGGRGLRYGKAESVRITNCRTFLSYGWLNPTTIIVPGARGYPPKFPNPKIPYRLPSVIHTADPQISLDEQKRRRSMAAFFTVLQAWPWEKPDNLCGIDLMTDDRSIDSMMNYVKRNCGDKSTTTSYGWKIDVEFVGDTLILVDSCRENKTFFDQAARAYGAVANNRSHWITINYCIGGMKWLVTYNAELWFNKSVAGQGDPRVVSGDFIGLKQNAPREQNIGVVLLGVQTEPSSVVEIMPHAFEHTKSQKVDLEKGIVPISSSKAWPSKELWGYRTRAWIK
ncbi:hypothetical protein IFR05_011561 [Cadophora sp. M221]|nr:hypothetical protein IFR05_011561 [Cadophora sp. M221]